MASAVKLLPFKNNVHPTSPHITSRAEGWEEELIIMIAMVCNEEKGQLRLGEPCFLCSLFVCIMTDMNDTAHSSPFYLAELQADGLAGPRSKTPARFGQRNSFSFPWTILYFLFFLSIWRE